MSDLARISRFEAKTTGDGSRIVLVAWGTSLRVEAASPYEAVAAAKRAYAEHLAETTGRRWVIYEATFGSATSEDRDIGPTLVAIPTLTTVTEGASGDPDRRSPPSDARQTATVSSKPMGVKAAAPALPLDPARAALTGESPMDEVLATIARVVRPEV